MPGIVLSVRQPKVNQQVKVCDLEGEKQVERPLKRKPSGDATKSLPESTMGAQTRQ